MSPKKRVIMAYPKPVGFYRVRPEDEHPMLGPLTELQHAAIVAKRVAANAEAYEVTGFGCHACGLERRPDVAKRSAATRAEMTERSLDESVN